MKKVILVDGNNLLFRSFYATSYSGVIMRNSRGFPTNGLYGFINMMNKILDEEKPEFVLVAFDKGKTFRHKKYDSYKAGRREMPEELKLQFPVAKEVLDALGIKHFEIDNYEADDIIGTLAKMVDEEDKFIATIVSSDKDLLQLISDDVEVKLLKQSDYIRMNKEVFKKYYGVDPINMIDLKALMGDSSDNIPGVRGIGEKSAIKLLSEYKTLDNLYKNIDNIKGAMQKKLIEGKENAYMSYDLATIYREVPIDFKLEDLKYEGINYKEYVNILKDLEFHSLLKKLDVKVESNNKKDIEIKDIDELDTSKHYSIYLEVLGELYSKGKIIGCGIYDGENGYFVGPDKLIDNREIFENNTEKSTYDVKKNIVLLNSLGIKVNNVKFDTMIATYLLDYTVKDDISFVAKYFDYDIPSYSDSFGTDKRPKERDIEYIKKLCIDKARFVYDTEEDLKKRLEKDEEAELFENIEMPLALVLADMELVGIRVNKEYLENMKIELEEKINSLALDIYDDAGCEFNIMSPKQLGVILFEKLEIPYPKRLKKNSYSTSKEILDKIRFINPIVDKILEYRTLNKLYTNYAVGLLSEIREDGRIHTVFNQTLTRTGRLSSISPNLQNIPIRQEYSKLVRKAFIADDNSLLMSSDYSQIELRMFAHMSNAENLIKAFVNGEDIHARTAADIHKIKLDDVTKKMRSEAKAVNFGILYGMSSFGLSEDLGINIAEAKEFLNKYLETYPTIRTYQKEELEEAKKCGYAKTIMNRKRVIEELKSKNFMIRAAGERIALNTPIQGSAADILKKAMVEIFDEFNKRGLKSKMLIQVHDELVFNVLKDEEEEVIKIVRDKMENVVKLKVPLKVEIEKGKDWYEAK